MKTYIFTPILIIAVTACASSSQSDFGGTTFPQNNPVRWASELPHSDGSQEETASLWATSPNALLSMRRAKEVGDLLTVVVEMNDQASMQGSLSRSTNSKENLSIEALLGLPQLAARVLPGGASLSPSIDFGRNSGLNGSGAVNRAEKITFTLAARVVGVEPTGNLIIEGFQQTQVSNEIRYLSVSGVIRAQDITRSNTVSYEKIADARLSYLSEGEATAAFKRRKIPKLLDWILPF